jgi:Uri superfamily endonuclease
MRSRAAEADHRHVEIRARRASRGTVRATTYQLHIEVERALRLRVGRLGTFPVPAGRYVYTGSARRGLEARVARHLRTRKRRHWHIDHLLAADGVRVVAVGISARTECAANLAVRGTTPVPGFGASDCRAGCGAHLKRLSTKRRRVA